MSDKYDPNNGKLTPSRNRSLAQKKSGLVKLGLNLMDERKKRELKVVLGDSQESFIGDPIYEIIRRAISDRYDMKVRWSCCGDDLSEFAETGEVDIFIFILNNITNSDATLSTADARLEYSLQILTQIKTTYTTPVIALSGFSKIAARVKLAGADFYLPLPCDAKDVIQAFEKCLEMLNMRMLTSG